MRSPLQRVCEQGDRLHPHVAAPEHREDYDEKAAVLGRERRVGNGFFDRPDGRGREGDDEGQVEFVASYLEKGVAQEHHELSTFKKETERVTS